MTFINGTYLDESPKTCLICDIKLEFGDSAVFWMAQKSFVVCAECAPHFAISFLRDAAKSSEFQNLSEKEVQHLKNLAEDAEFHLSVKQGNL